MNSINLQGLQYNSCGSSRVHCGFWKVLKKKENDKKVSTRQNQNGKVRLSRNNLPESIMNSHKILFKFSVAPLRWQIVKKTEWNQLFLARELRM